MTFSLGSNSGRTEDAISGKIKAEKLIEGFNRCGIPKSLGGSQGLILQTSCYDKHLGRKSRLGKPRVSDIYAMIGLYWASVKIVGTKQ